MAKAQFHKNQRVYVRPVGTWTHIERVLPHWTKGLTEPIRIHYDVGMGREFAADELQSEANGAGAAADGEEWRVVRSRNKWLSDQESKDHPYPGTYPIVQTADNDWGGWRVPGAEYALSPTRIERQARIMASSLHMLTILEKLKEFDQRNPDNWPDELKDTWDLALKVLAYVNEDAT